MWGSEVENRHVAWEAFESAETVLSRNPSVRASELGFKVSDGELLPQLAIRVYVDAKLPAAAVPRDCLIPPVIAGLPTDVLAVRDEAFLGHDMVGGDQLTRVVWNESGTGSGTLGYMATRQTDSATVMLCNEHVFRSDLGEGERREIYQPDISRCLGSTCNKVGYVADGFIGDVTWASSGTPSPHFVDCAIGEVVDASSKRGVKDLPAITGDQDISTTPVGPGEAPLPVKKIGATTGRTEGVVVSVNSTGHQKVGPIEILNQPRTILIRTTNGPFFEETFTVPAGEVSSIKDAFNALGGPGTVSDAGTNQLRFRVPTFSRGGDSGSAIVSASGGIVGLLYASAIFSFPAIEGTETVRKTIPVGESRACHIGPVMNRMGVRIDPSTSPSAGPDVFVPGVAIAASKPDPSLRERIDALEIQLRSSPTGRRFFELIRKHGREVVQLVHHHRAVKVAWHRHHGPAFAALVVDHLRDSARFVPRAHQGKTFSSLLSAMADVFVRHGSPALGAAIEAHRCRFLDCIARSRSVDEFMVALASEPSAVE